MIPRRLHHFWHEALTPEPYRSVLGLWQALHPDWEHFLWTPNNLPTLINQTMFDNPQRWHMEKRVEQMRSNVVRLEVLYRFGGIWTDVDVQPLRSFEPLLGYEAFIGGGAPGQVSTAVIGAESEHPFVSDMIVELGKTLPSGIGTCASVGVANSVTPQHHEVKVFDTEIFCPLDHVGSGTCDIRKSYAINLWSNQSLNDTKIDPTPFNLGVPGDDVHVRNRVTRELVG